MEQTQDLKHYVRPHFEHYNPDIAVTDIGSNNMSYNNLDIDASKLAENIKIGKKCIYYGVEEVIISSVFVKESIRIYSLIRIVNDENNKLNFEKRISTIYNKLNSELYR